MPILRRVADLISRISEAAMCLAIAGIAVSVAASVFLRNFLSLSIDVIVDVNRILFVWATFFGLVRVNGAGTLIRFDLVEQRISSGVLRTVLRAAQKAACLALYAVMAAAGVQVLAFAKAQTFPTMQLSLSWLYLPVSVSGVLLVVQTLASFADLWAKDAAE